MNDRMRSPTALLLAYAALCVSSCAGTKGSGMDCEEFTRIVSRQFQGQTREDIIVRDLGNDTRVDGIGAQFQGVASIRSIAVHSKIIIVAVGRGCHVDVIEGNDPEEIIATLRNHDAYDPELIDFDAVARNVFAILEIRQE